jgi:NAD(P)-dependent dehydrogenase (short-subunit alcohol dehydrogenase family)
MSRSPVVLVTGAAGGLGSAVAARFARGGWHVIGSDRDGVSAPTGVATWITADLLSVEQCGALLTQAINAAGHLDAVVNAAGLWTEGPSELTTEAEWDRVQAVNVKGVFFGTKHAVAPMRRAGGGSVVNLSSIAGLVGLGSVPPSAVRPNGRAR